MEEIIKKTIEQEFMYRAKYGRTNYSMEEVIYITCKVVEECFWENKNKVSHDIGIMDNNNAPNYCSKCGCRLDWSDEDENKI